jgi:hypothetical protein
MGRLRWRVRRRVLLPGAWLEPIGAFRRAGRRLQSADALPVGAGVVPIPLPRLVLPVLLAVSPLWLPAEILAIRHFRAPCRHVREALWRTP